MRAVGVHNTDDVNTQVIYMHTPTHTHVCSLRPQLLTVGKKTSPERNTVHMHQSPDVEPTEVSFCLRCS